MHVTFRCMPPICHSAHPSKTCTTQHGDDPPACMRTPSSCTFTCSMAGGSGGTAGAGMTAAEPAAKAGVRASGQANPLMPSSTPSERQLVDGGSSADVVQCKGRPATALDRLMVGARSNRYVGGSACECVCAFVHMRAEVEGRSSAWQDCGCTAPFRVCSVAKPNRRCGMCSASTSHHHHQLCMP